MDKCYNCKKNRLNTPLERIGINKFICIICRDTAKRIRLKIRKVRINNSSNYAKNEFKTRVNEIVRSD